MTYKSVLFQGTQSDDLLESVLFQSTQSDDLIDKLEVSEKLMKEMSKTWEEKLHETERVHQVGAE